VAPLFLWHISLCSFFLAPQGALGSSCTFPIRPTLGHLCMKHCFIFLENGITTQTLCIK
jgi:hypothetical protein